MTITVTFKCDGCPKEEPGTDRLKTTFRSFDGKGWGFGVYEENTLEDITPKGWIAKDPYTHLCYCPDCWAEIVGEEAS